MALRYPYAGGVAEVTYGELTDRAFAIARGLIALGIEPGDRVSILGSTRAEWTLCDLGIVCAGAVVAPIYHTNSPAECGHVLGHSQARLVFCEDAAQAAKIAEIRGSCPELEHVIVIEDGEVPDAMPLSELRRRGEEVDATVVDDRVKAVGPDDLATIVYTSGTTGPAKGCMLTHGNFIAATRMIRGELLLDELQPVVYMFLPLAHVLARVTQAVVLDVGGVIAYWGGDPKTDRRGARGGGADTLPGRAEDLREDPTAVVSGVEAQVPRFGGHAAAVGARSGQT